MIQPWSTYFRGSAEDDIELDRCGTVARSRVYGAELGRHEAVALHRGESFSERPDTLVKVVDRQLELNPDASLEQRLRAGQHLLFKTLRVDLEENRLGRSIAKRIVERDHGYATLPHGPAVGIEAFTLFGQRPERAEHIVFGDIDFELVRLAADGHVGQLPQRIAAGIAFELGEGVRKRFERVNAAMIADCAKLGRELAAVGPDIDDQID